MLERCTASQARPLAAAVIAGLSSVGVAACGSDDGTVTAARTSPAVTVAEPVTTIATESAPTTPASEAEAGETKSSRTKRGTVTSPPTGAKPPTTSEVRAAGKLVRCLTSNGVAVDSDWKQRLSDADPPFDADDPSVQKRLLECQQQLNTGARYAEGRGR